MASSAQGAGAAGEQATREMASVAGDPPPAGPSPVTAGDDPFAERPELFVGAAFAGGLVLAQILKRLGR